MAILFAYSVPTLAVSHSLFITHVRTLCMEDATEIQFSSFHCVNPGLKLMNCIAERK